MKALPYSAKSNYYSMIYVPEAIFTMIYKTWSVLSKESTQYVDKYYICPKIIKGVPFPERNTYHFLLFSPTITQVPKNISKATTCTFDAISQHKM